MFAESVTQQGLGQIGEFTKGADPFRVDDLAEAGQMAGVTFVMGKPLEKGLILALGEVGADTDLILSHQVEDVFDGLDIVVDGGVNAVFQERRNMVTPTKPP